MEHPGKKSSIRAVPDTVCPALGLSLYTAIKLLILSFAALKSVLAG